MGKFSREKGKRGEREVVKFLKEYGYNARRSVQYCGANGDADVVGLPDVHIEVKRTERFNAYDALSQARADATLDEFPVVFHKKNNCGWIAVMFAEDFMEFYQGYEETRDEGNEKAESNMQKLP